MNTTTKIIFRLAPCSKGLMNIFVECFRYVEYNLIENKYNIFSYN